MKEFHAVVVMKIPDDMEPDRASKLLEMMINVGQNEAWNEAWDESDETGEGVEACQIEFVSVTPEMKY